LYVSPNIITIMICTGHIARMVEVRNLHKILVGKREKTSLGRPGHRWEDNLEYMLRK